MGPGGWWRRRLTAILAMGALVALAFAIRMLAGTDSTLAQYSGTALYAAMVYAGVVALAPAARAWQAGAAALGFCWAVELLQLTGVPAELSAHSVLARLALGVRFDATDLLWYAVGVVPLVLVHGSWSARPGPGDRSRAGRARTIRAGNARLRSPSLAGNADDSGDRSHAPH